MSRKADGLASLRNALLVAGLAAVLALALPSCGGREGSESGPDGSALTVHSVSDPDFVRYLRRQVGLSPEELERAAIDQLLEEFYAELLFAKEAERLGLAVDPEALRREIALLESLEAGGTVADFEEEARRAVLARLYEAEVLLPDVSIEAKEVEEHLGKRRGRVGRRYMVFRQILVEEKSAAEDVYRRVTRGREPFAAVATEISLGADQGALQQVLLDDLPRDAARSLERVPEGGVSRPVRVGDYYYVFQVDARNYDADPGRARERALVEHKLFQERLDTLRRERLVALAAQEGLALPPTTAAPKESHE